MNKSLNRWRLVPLPIVILMTWVIAQFVLGFLWGIGMFLLGGENKELVERGHAFGGSIAWLGILQGLWGGLFQSVMLFYRGTSAPWTRSQWICDGLVATLLITCIWLMPVAHWRTFVGWLFFPISAVLISYGCTTYIVNQEISPTATRND